MDTSLHPDFALAWLYPLYWSRNHVLSRFTCAVAVGGLQPIWTSFERSVRRVSIQYYGIEVQS